MKKAELFILCLLTSATGFAAGFSVAGNFMGRSLKAQGKEFEKSQRREHFYDNWMMAKKYGTPMEEMLLRMGWHRVAIYGMQQLGIRLYHELKDTPVEVVCSFDRNPKNIIYGVTNYKKPDLKEAPPVDGVIVSNFVLYDEIEDVLRRAGYTNVIALDELVFQMLEDKQMADMGESDSENL